jgi:hypothetical protein
VDIEFPYTPKPEDLTKLLNQLPDIEVPASKADSAFFKTLGFTASSSKYLINILKLIGFIDDSNNASEVWKHYRTDEQRNRLFAFRIKQAYLELFQKVMCPYLEEDDALYDYFRNRTKSSPKVIFAMVETFHILNNFADYQDLMDDSGSNDLLPADTETKKKPQIKVNPNPQWNIQVHIDPNTPDEKIETIFKNMRKYLLGNDN